MLILLLLALFTILIKPAEHVDEATVNIQSRANAPIPLIPSAISTKWWIKATAPAEPSAAPRLPPQISTSLLTSTCSEQPSSRLKPNIYAYVSLTPPLPNRIRSSASLSSNYIGQIYPGGGLWIIDGPICADGYLWWFVESRQNGLRGWTVSGRKSERWMLPCPIESVACAQTVTSTTTSVAADNERRQGSNQNICTSYKFAIGIFVQVEQDSLLILRSQPYTGEVIGRAGPMSVGKVIEGPTCNSGTTWWKLNVFDLGLVGWATENDLYVCPKDSECSLESFQ